MKGRKSRSGERQKVFMHTSVAMCACTTTTIVLAFPCWIDSLTCTFLFIFLYVDVGTIIEVQQHIIAAKAIETTNNQAPGTATECAPSTSQVEPSAAETGSPTPQVVELLTSEFDTPSPQEMQLVDMSPTAEESDNSISSPPKLPFTSPLEISQISLKLVYTLIFPTILYTYVAQPIICYESSIATDNCVNNTLFFQTHCFWKWRWKS